MQIKVKVKMNNLRIIKQIKLQRAITHSDLENFTLTEDFSTK